MARTLARVNVETGRWYPSGMGRDGIVRVLRAFEEVSLEDTLIGVAAAGIHDLVRAIEDLDLVRRGCIDAPGRRFDR